MHLARYISSINNTCLEKENAWTERVGVYPGLEESLGEGEGQAKERHDEVGTSKVDEIDTEFTA